MKKLNRNFIFSIFYQLLLYLVPFLFTPYLSRIFLPTDIGAYAFTFSIVSFFMLATLLGINNYGSRTIATTTSRAARSKVFWSIYGLQFRLGLLLLLLYNLIIFLFLEPNFHTLAFIQNLFLLSATFDISWFYFGIERFRTTLFRSFLTKTLTLVAVFLLVKAPSDLPLYAFIMAFSTLLGQLYLFLPLFSHLDFRPAPFRSSLTHLRPVLVLFIPVLAYSIYRIIDKTMLGVLSSTSELGLYDHAEKIINLPVGILAALGTVMIPHMSKTSLSSQKLLQSEMNKSFQLVFTLMLPAVALLFFAAGDLSLVYFGSKFESSAPLISLLSLSIIFAAVANVIRTNFLIPLKKDRIYVFSTLLAAGFNLLLNLLLIPLLGAVGACIGTIVAEATVCLYQFFATRRQINYHAVRHLFLVSLAKTAVLSAILFLLSLLPLSAPPRLMLKLSLSLLLFLLLNFPFLKSFFLPSRETSK